MKKIINRIVFLFMILLAVTTLHAQGSTSQSTFGSTMRSEGRIYVVIAVILTILAGLIIYIVRIDRKLKKLESQS